ncbi:site-specific DNA-methyltransferase [Treponema sp. TIM-1]
MLEDPSKSYHAKHRTGKKDIFDNRLIFGDNLLALKALEQEFTGKVKCVYIDPPYNTGSAFEHYDDGIEHSIWLGLMRDRLELLKKLLSKDGCILVQIDANEMAYLKLIMDEIFGRPNLINVINCKTKIAGVSGSHLGNSLQDNVEYILFYAKDAYQFKLNVIPQKQQELMKYIQDMEDDGKSWKYTSVMESMDSGEYISDIIAGNGDIIRLYKHKDVIVSSIKHIADKYCKGNIRDTYYKYINKIFRTTNAQTSIRTKVIEATKNIKNDYFSIEYIPTKGKNAGRLTRFYYKNDNLIAWLKDVVVKNGNNYIKLDNMGNLWDDIQYNNLTKEGGVQFPNGKKPEVLVSRIIDMCTGKGDLVLDSFAGSGTTGAVAHKMGRRWIMVELGEHCHTHIIPRLKKVIDGEDPGGVTEAADWKGGGGFRYYRLAPSLLKKDKWGNWIINKEYNAPMLAEAVCKLEGFSYEPSDSVYWIHGRSTENDFIYVTTAHLTHEQLALLSEDVGSRRTLLVMCTAFRSRSGGFPNLTIKKIPNTVLAKCEWGHDDYSLQVENLPMAKKPIKKQGDLFEEDD